MAITLEKPAGFLNVTGGFRLPWWDLGNPKGIPILHLHGGPGGYTRPEDLGGALHHEGWRVLAMDQRGCGKSRPGGRLVDNTTAHLVADIAAFLDHLGIDRVVLAGVSWGTTLALAFAMAHPNRVLALALTGVWLGDGSDIHWLYKGGAPSLMAQAYEAFLEPLSENERKDPVEAYRRGLVSGTAQQQNLVAARWCAWEASLYGGEPTPHGDFLDRMPRARYLARIESHYMANRCFMEEGEILAGAKGLSHIPVEIVQGRMDLICPTVGAWKLHRAMPWSNLDLVSRGTHGIYGLPMSFHWRQMLGGLLEKLTGPQDAGSRASEENAPRGAWAD